MHVTIFDLDGTLTWRDSFAGFIIGYLRRNPGRWFRVWRIPAVLLRFLINGRDRGLLKQDTIQIFMRGDLRPKIDVWAQEFSTAILRSGCRPAALAVLDAHRRSGDFLVLLSASPSLYVPRIGSLLRFDRVICTEVAFDGDTLRGELTTPNRRGEEKARCLRELRAEFPDAVVTAYGNSASDLAHLQLADLGMLVNPAAMARRHARDLKVAVGDWR